MPRPEKVAAVSEIKDRLSGAQAVFLAEYAGLSVKAQQALRRGLRAKDAEFQVVKMTLARRAAAELELEELGAMLMGPTGLTFADGDAAAAAKVLKDFAAANEVFTIKGGLLGTTVLSAERIGELAEIEPRPVLLAKLAGLFQAPASAMAGLLATLPRGAATMFQQLLDRLVGIDTAADKPDEATVSAEVAEDVAAAADDDEDVAAADDAGAAEGAEDTAAAGEDTAAVEAVVGTADAAEDVAATAGEVPEDTADKAEDTAAVEVVEETAEVAEDGDAAAAAAEDTAEAAGATAAAEVAEEPDEVAGATADDTAEEIAEITDKDETADQAEEEK